MTATRTVIQPIGAQNPINLSLSCAYTFCRRSFARFLNPGYAQAAMNSVVDTIVAASASSEAQLPSRVFEIKPEESKLVCVGADGREFALSRLVGSNVRIGDDVLVPASTGTATADTEVYIRKPSLRRADVYQVKAGYAALPKLDKREEPFVRVQVAEGQLGINAIHIPCPVIRDYFFAANRRASWPSQPTFYYVLRLPQDVTYKELRLAYRLRRLEFQKQNASKAELATIERAYNMLADPDIRGVYDALIKDSAIPVPFPYSGFGSLLVQGERSAESGVFFANRILAFMPERRRRTVPVPLRKLDYFEDYAILRDRHRKLEVLIDHQLLPLRWDPTWSQWRHLITATVEISADFIHTGRYRKRGRRVETNRMGNRAPQPNRAGNARRPRRRHPQGAEYTHALRSVLATDRPSPRPRARDSHGARRIESAVLESRSTRRL